MSTSLSFAPCYHELTVPYASGIWMPTGHPNLACVVDERQRIEAEGFHVETRPEKLEHLLAPARAAAEEQLKRDRAQSAHELKQATVALVVALGVVLLLSYVFGTLAARWLYPTWFGTLSWLPATAVVFGVGVLVAVPVLFAIIRPFLRVETK